MASTSSMPYFSNHFERLTPPTCLSNSQIEFAPKKTSFSKTIGKTSESDRGSLFSSSVLDAAWPGSTQPSEACSPPNHITNMFQSSSGKCEEFVRCLTSFGANKPEEHAFNSYLPGAPNVGSEECPPVNLALLQAFYEEFLRLHGGPAMSTEMAAAALSGVPLEQCHARLRGGLSGATSTPGLAPSAAGSLLHDQLASYAAMSGEHPYGEHPSRTLFVRNINSNVDDAELRALFATYGEIRSLYTACKHRGFVMVSYYDIRHAKAAMRHLQGRSVRRRKLDIHYSIPKENPSDKEQNQGTLVVFNLDPALSHDDLRALFGQYGEVKEIRETPNKRHHKFVEFYDIRDAEKAMRVLNKTEVRGRKIKIEPSRPGGTRKALMAQLVSPAAVQDGGEAAACAQLSAVHSPSSPSSSASSSPLSASPLASPPLGPAPGPAPPTLFALDGLATSDLPFTAGPSNTTGHPEHLAVNPMSQLSDITGLGELFPSPTAAASSLLAAPASRTSNGVMDGDRLQFTLHLDRIRSGEDKRTTIMIRNIPNKYTQRMLLATIDETHRGQYDFFYLPIDFKNRCNVGYAFINFLYPSAILSFYDILNRKKWEKFNSDKVCELTYARIQGKNALVSHFQNSSLLCEDKKYRPIIFNQFGEQEPFPAGPKATGRRPNFTSATRR